MVSVSVWCGGIFEAFGNNESIESFQGLKGRIRV